VKVKNTKFFGENTKQLRSPGTQ